jgi:hypothetical protein
MKQEAGRGSVHEKVIMNYNSTYSHSLDRETRILLEKTPAKRSLADGKEKRK